MLLITKPILSVDPSLSRTFSCSTLKLNSHSAHKLKYILPLLAETWLKLGVEGLKQVFLFYGYNKTTNKGIFNIATKVVATWILSGM